MQYSSDDLDESLDSHTSSPNHRPNRFLGSASTWRKLTEEERSLSHSLTKLRDQDLSIHLYNSFALQKRQYDAGVTGSLKQWASRERWRKIRNVDGEEDGSAFVPPQSWTAWPMTAETVPRTGGQVGTGDQDTEIWTLKRTDGQWPSHELEEILIGTTLRLAKERFEAREWDESSTDNDQVVAKNSDDAAMELDTGENQETVRRHSADSDMVDDDSTQTGARNRPPESSSDERVEIPTRRTRQPPPETKFPAAKPILSADDERSSQILLPTVRHVLAQIDRLLYALHETRKSCLYYGSERDGSQIEAESRRDLPSLGNRTSPPFKIPSLSSPVAFDKPVKGRPGRSRKAAPISENEGKLASGFITASKETSFISKTKLEEEPHKEGISRLGKLGRQSLPGSPLQSGSPGSRSRPKVTRSRSRRGTSTHAREKRLSFLGLRDWSEVVGTAALVGFPPDVIARTTKRCANLFGETISFISLPENERLGQEEALVTQYKPSSIRDLEYADKHGYESDEEAGRLARPSGARVSQSQSLKSEPSSPIARESYKIRHTGSRFLCPYPRCPREANGYGSRGHLSRHLKTAHRVTTDDLKDKLEESSAEMEGAIHTDGFLKEVRRRPGWRGRDEEKRVRKSGTRYKIRGSGGDTSIGEELQLESDEKITR